MAEAQPSGAESDKLGGALRAARRLEAAHMEAVTALTDAKSLRLQILKDELAPIVASSPEAVQAFDLALIPGEEPRLWIDLITYVVMEPDPRTYRLIEDRAGGRELQFETAVKAEMVEQVKRAMAHRLIARQRQWAVPEAGPSNGFRYSTASLMLAWLAGFALGALALLSAVIYLKLLD